MKLKKREAYGAVIVDIEGKLIGGPDNVDEFHSFFKSLLDQGMNRIVVNLRKTPWANSQGVGMLIGAHTSATNAGGELVLSNILDRIDDILTTTRLLLIFKTFDTEEEAIKYLNETK